MPTPTYTLINSVTVGSGGAANITFTSIPGTYTDLLVKLSSRTTSNYGNAFAQVDMSLNSTGYSNDRVLFATNSSVSSNNGGVGTTYGNNSSIATASTFSNTDIYIPNYAGSSQKITASDGVAETNSTTAAIVSVNATLFNVTSAVTSLTLTPNSSGNFAENSTAYLYGIKNS
jgi:hypothetical protein